METSETKVEVTVQRCNGFIKIDLPEMIGGRTPSVIYIEKRKKGVVYQNYQAKPYAMTKDSADANWKDIESGWLSQKRFVLEGF